MRLKTPGRVALVVTVFSLAIALLLFLYTPQLSPAGRSVTLDAYPIEFGDDGSVLRGPWQGRYEVVGDSLICLGDWERLSGGGNMISTPRGLYRFMMTDATMTLTPISSGTGCPAWAATIPPPPL